MPNKYTRAMKNNKKRVSFEDSARFNFEAPRSSMDDRRSIDTPYHAPENNRDDSDDEIDNLLAEDPLYDEKELSRKRKGSRLGRKKRRAVIFGMITLTLGIIAALVLVGFHTHARVKAAAEQSAADVKQQSDMAAAMEEIADMTEVPSLAGTLPLYEPAEDVHTTIPIADSDLSDSLASEDAIISVPATKIDWSSEAEDKIAYEAEVAKAGLDEITSSSPPDLSAEAIAQAQGLNGQLDEASAEVAAMAEDSASKISAHKGDPMQVVKDSFAEFWAWLDATWADITGNSEDSDEPIY